MEERKMTSLLRRRKVDTLIEKRVVTGLICSTEYIRKISPNIKLDFFQSTFTKKVAKWALDYYKLYEEACKEHIADIWMKERMKIKEEEEGLIEKLLLEISEQYDRDGEINVDYLVDRTLEYFTVRELELIKGNLDACLSQGDIEGAQESVLKHKKFMRGGSSWVNPFEERYIEEVFTERGNKEPFFKFPGQLGEFVGEIEREYFVTIAGPFKKGKTWVLQEVAVVGMLTGRKVVIFSLEMNRRKLNERLFKRILGAADEEGGQGTYPCFDCLLNQEDSCDSPHRTNWERLLDDSGQKPEFSDDLIYRPCTYCREHPNSQYIPATWFETIVRPPFNYTNVLNKTKFLPNNLRVMIYPRFSANLSDINHDLDLLYFNEDFAPEIIIIDYPDILKSEGKRGGVEDVDDTWKSIAKLTGERHAAVFVVTQVTREALEKVSVKQGNIAGWIGKIAHVDVMLSINQTQEEKKAGVMRMGYIVHRHNEFSEDRFCWMLQNLSYGQVLLDSQIVQG